MGVGQAFASWKALANLVLAMALYAFVVIALILGLVALSALTS